ncbi:MAG: 2-hydroxyacid dehydrogenase [Thermaceae bacterium]
MRLLAPRLKPEAFALLPEEVEVVYLADPLPPEALEAEVLIPPYGERDLLLRLFPRMPRLKLVQTLSAGVDWIVDIVPEGVILADGSGIHDVPVAEWVIGAILAGLKRFLTFCDQQRVGLWRPERVLDLEGKTVLILGYGSIGQAVEVRLKPFGVEILRVARTERPGVYTPKDLPHLLPKADVVVLLLPLTPETRGLVNGDFLAQMKPGALFVNAGRGELVKTEALREGRIRAALDVTDPEPLPEDHPLWGLPGVFITPHVAGLSEGFFRRAGRFLAEQLGRYLKGEPLLNVVRWGY